MIQWLITQPSTYVLMRRSLSEDIAPMMLCAQGCEQGCAGPLRFTKHVQCKLSKSCVRTFRFAEWDGEDGAIEQAKKFQHLLKLAMKEFGSAKNKDERNEILAQHNAKPKKSKLETETALEMHLFQGLSPHFEKQLQPAAVARQK